MSRISRAMLLRCSQPWVDGCVDELEEGLGLAFAAALRRGEQEGDAVPALDLAAVPAIEARAE